MPCNSITTQSVALAKAMPSILMDALKAEGWAPNQENDKHIVAWKGSSYLNWTAGQGVTIRGLSRERNQQAVTAVTKAYSVQAVTWAAQRAGWQVKQTGANKLTVSRR